jgi:hypothetical protein
MCKSTQSDHNLFRILLYRNDLTELLVEAKSDGLRLPAVPVPVHTRTAEQITTAIQRMWELETYCLFPLTVDNSSEISVIHQVVEAYRIDRHVPTGMRWLPLTALSAHAFEDSRDYEAKGKSIALLDQYRNGQLVGAFGKPEWFREVTAWVEALASAADLHLNGRFRQLNACPTFSLLRFETDGPAVWFKAVGEPNVNEYSITLTLASTFPEFVPHILGSRKDWNAWLMLEAVGSELGANSSACAWETVAENLAFLEIASLGRRFELIDAGSKDLRPWALYNLVDPFFDSMTELMERQTKPLPAPLSRDELLALGLEIRSALEELEAAGVPNTLGHLDMNPGNVVVSDPGCVFLDWAEAYVGPPFFSLEYLLQHWRRMRQEDPDAKPSLLSRYAKVWSRFASSEQIATSFKLAPLLAAFAYAAGGVRWQRTENIGSETASYLRSLVRRMKREVDLLREGRLECLP